MYYKTFLIIATIIILRQAHVTVTSDVTTISSTTVDPDEDWDEDESTEIEDDGKIYKNPRNSPSSQCPRDEEQAALLGQKCLRKCSSDEDCKSKKKKCLCDGACGMSCIKPDRECPEPEQIPLGSVIASGRLFGARASYTCQHGYHVVGLQSRSCQADGQWAGSPPACKQNIYCLSPPVIEHARHNALPEQTTFDLDSTLQYFCHTGYVTNGFPRAKCLAIDGQASWYGPDISCEPRSCGTPTTLPHGWHVGECYTFGCKINYHCADGYELVGRQERVCQADGLWFPKELPTCVRDATRRCGADRKWSGSTPVCKEINCGHPGRLWNGWLENIEGGTGLGASIIFRCHEGKRLVGHSSTVCQIDGKWRYPLPKCLAPCVVPQVSHGQVIMVSRNDTPTASTLVKDGESLTVDCEENYEFPDMHLSVVCNNGTWTHIPSCVPARCKHLPRAPKNGMVIAPKMEHGMKAKFKCRDGYEVLGNDTVSCSFGEWVGEIPSCQEVFCPYPGFFENGKILLVGNMGLYDYRPYVKKIKNNKQIMYDCDKGYVLTEGPPGATCVGGTWRPQELPKCTYGQHPRLRWSRRKRSAAIESYKRGLIRHHKLIYGQNNGKYTSYYENVFEHLKAYGVDPGNYFSNSTLRKRHKRALRTGGSVSSSRTIGISLSKSSKSTSTNSRKKSNKHDNDGKFEEDPKRKSRGRGPCDSIASEPYVVVEIIKHGREPNVSFSSGTIVNVACGKGYILNLEGNSTAKCVRGRWKPRKPKCEIIPCPNPDIPHAVIKLSDSEPYVSSSEEDEFLNDTSKFQNGQVVEVTCEPGYSMQGSSTMRCWHGEWTVTTMAECSAAPCQLPPIPNGQYLSGYREGLTIANGSSVNFQCDEPYLKITSKPIQCILGDLHPRRPACRSPNSPDPDDINYLGGSDIIKGGDINVLEYGSSAKPCGPPARVQGSLVYRNGKPMIDNEKNFPHGTEVTFSCIESIMGEKTTWKIICEDGSWIGRSLNCDSDELMSTHNLNNNSTCLFRNQEPNVVSFYNDQEIREDVVDFPAGAVLISRCVDIGKYAMTGPSKRRCIGGEWDGPKPSCFGLNQENDYSMEKPPTILFRHQLGPIAQSSDGKLIVYPGTILHMECLWMRRFGVPKWETSTDYRKYPQGWTTDEGRDPQLEYRLSIFHATKDDSGVYTCVTPARYTHAVEIVVKAVHCPPVPQRRGLVGSSESTKMNTKITFSCANGNALIGSSEVVCLPSGNWSSPFPVCESIECGEVGPVLPPHLRVTVISREVGGRAVFSCTPGFGLRGALETTCLSTGEWATPFPTCEEVHCEHPGTPENGYIQGSGPFKAGDVVQFNCNPDFMMDGQPIIACQDNSRWSGPLPKCVQACSYPGTTISGRMSSVKFYYKIGENITFECDEGLQLRGAAMLKCLKNGKWSNTIPTCVPPN
ncbi:sushi, von Willebrand factor type A, EGF and pentraxin domain-containing protein 1 isoform X2 [Agrilus planipennis]|uniref:Sushi, von Willebrand factor type A, EGF and pentraxin domain-containing protein 1 isoform X2 n=1 Tax=Agrilus planipennis TaxID=224129 RepID=A0A7F5RAY0_AGRPL|nr:sushi, von Willebrand factor type A, EGF and pentraxin domain-containing protein 1 isoform X2 [Agrilus planipennis]